MCYTDACRGRNEGRSQRRRIERRLTREATSHSPQGGETRNVCDAENPCVYRRTDAAQSSAGIHAGPLQPSCRLAGASKLALVTSGTVASLPIRGVHRPPNCCSPQPTSPAARSPPHLQPAAHLTCRPQPTSPAGAVGVGRREAVGGAEGGDGLESDRLEALLLL